MKALRMTPFALVSIACYALALNVADIQIQTLLWKIGHITVAAHVGYWIDVAALGHVTGEDQDTRRVARALIIAGAMLAIAMGL